MTIDDKLKTALDENRLLILGTQVLFGFQFHAIFQDQFDQLSPVARALQCSGLTLLMLTVALLIAPSMEHRIVERGQNSPHVLGVARVLAGWALLPVSIALAFDMYVAMGQIIDPRWAILTGCLFFLIAVASWYLLAFALKKGERKMPERQSGGATPIDVRVNHLLTEARLIIPGAQALLGFQLVVTLTKAFSELPPESKIAHAVALCCLAVAVLFLMAPASLHRIGFNGENDPQVLKVGSWFVIAAPLPLALAIALDTYVAAGRAVESRSIAFGLAGAAIVVLLGTWYAYPIWRRTSAQ